MAARDDTLIQILNDRFDDQLQSMQMMFKQINEQQAERNKNVLERLALQDRAIEEKHIQNASKSQDIESRLIKVEKKLSDAQLIIRFLLWLFGAVGMVITWAVGLLDPFVRAIKSAKGMV